MSKIIVEPCEGDESIEVKRFYPPFYLKAECPWCGEMHSMEDYLSYPEMNRPMKNWSIYCPDQQDWYFIKGAILRVSLDISNAEVVTDHE